MVLASDGPSDGVVGTRERILTMVAATPSPTRPEGRRRATLAVLGSLGAALAIFEGAGGMGHAAGRPLARTLAIAVGWGLFSAGLSWLVLKRRAMLGRRPAIMLLAALATPTALFAWMVVFAGTYAEPFSRVGYRCLGYTLAMAALPLASFFALRRGIEPRGPGALGAAIGATAGAWAGLLVDLWCPLSNAPHVLVGHVLPIAVLIGAGTLLGRQMLGVRWREASAEISRARAAASPRPPPA